MKIEGAESALITASLKTEDKTYECIGTVLAKEGCWSFLKGGFVLDSPSNLSILYFHVKKQVHFLSLTILFPKKTLSSLLFLQNSDDKDLNIAVASSSLQPFSAQQWRNNQQYIINTVSTVAFLLQKVLVCVVPLPILNC